MSGRVSHYYPEGERIRTSARPICGKNEGGMSKGKEKWRIKFAELPYLEYYVAEEKIGGCFGSKALPFTIFINSSRETIWLNFESLRKRFNLDGRTLIDASLNDRLDQLVEKVKIRILKKSIDWQSASIRFSKKVDLTLTESVTINPNGFVAIDHGNKIIGQGGNAKVKLSRDLDGTLMARRICLNPKLHRELFPHLHLFRNKIGIIHTIDMAVYTNKNRQQKAVSYHPLYDHNLREALKEDRFTPSDRMKIASDLLIGLATIADQGFHGDIRMDNILLRRVDGECEAVICDFDFFNYAATRNHICAAPELIFKMDEGIVANSKMDVWSLGAIFYFLFQTEERKSTLPSVVLSSGYVNENAAYEITQENINQKIVSKNFPNKIGILLTGMLQVEPEKRMTAREALEFFRRNMMSDVSPSWEGDSDWG